jgi:UDP-glucose 4-epimerase
MKKVIVTGGGGFIGRHMVKALLEKGHDVHVIDTLMNEFTGKRTDETKLHAYMSKDFIKNNLYEIDILDYERMSSCLQGADAVIHLAAFISSPNSINEPKKAFETNISGTLNVLEAARVHGCKNVILTSSAAVYGSLEGKKKEDDPVQPENPYGMSKYIDEQLGKLYCNLYGMNVAMVRYSNVWGPDQHDSGSYAPAIGRFILQTKNKEPLTICGDGLQTRDFIHVRDVVQANLALLENIEKEAVRGEVFNVCTGTESRILDLAQLIKSVAEDFNYKKIKLVHIEPRIEPKRFVGDNTKLYDAIGWTPTIKLKEGIKELFASTPAPKIRSSSDIYDPNANNSSYQDTFQEQYTPLKDVNHRSS